MDNSSPQNSERQQTKRNARSSTYPNFSSRFSLGLHGCFFGGRLFSKRIPRHGFLRWEKGELSKFELLSSRRLAMVNEIRLQEWLLLLCTIWTERGEFDRHPPKRYQLSIRGSSTFPPPPEEKDESRSRYSPVLWWRTHVLVVFLFLSQRQPLVVSPAEQLPHRLVCSRGTCNIQ